VAGKLLPDTNAFIAVARRFEHRGNLRGASEIVLSAVVFGELTYGAMNSGLPEANLAKLEKLRNECSFAPVDEAVVHCYGQSPTRPGTQGPPDP
jgi:predicted nucleic acid-binding protein